MLVGKNPNYQNQINLRKRNIKSLWFLSVIVISMLGLSYASVPLYELFCRVTGYGGTTQIAKQESEKIIKGHDVKIIFNAHVNPELNWSFNPITETVNLLPGEHVKAIFRATNLSDDLTIGTSTFNVTPQKVGPYFMKMECFCFTEQPLAPGESVDMPVVFYLDPEIASDKNTTDVEEVVLSYTFFKSLKS